MTENTQDVFRQIERLVRRKYQSFTLRVLLLKPNRFVTACMEFSELPPMHESEPEILDYPAGILASFNNDVDTWHDFAGRLISGDLMVGSSKPPMNLSFETTRDELYLEEWSKYPRKLFLFFQTAHEQLWTNSPFIGRGLPPFTNSADAAARYVHRTPVALNQTPHENKFVISIPEQSKIRLVEWLPGELRVRLASFYVAGGQLDI